MIKQEKDFRFPTFVIDGSSHSKTGIFYVSSQMTHFTKGRG